MGNSLHRGPIWGPGGEVRLLGTLEDSKRVLIKQSVSLSLWELSEGNLKEGLLDWELRQVGLISTPDFGPYSDCKDQTIVL